MNDKHIPCPKCSEQMNVYATDLKRNKRGGVWITRYICINCMLRVEKRRMLEKK